MNIRPACVCVCVYVYVTLTPKLLVLRAKWGRFSPCGPTTSKDLEGFRLGLKVVLRTGFGSAGGGWGVSWLGESELGSIQGVMARPASGP